VVKHVTPIRQVWYPGIRFLNPDCYKIDTVFKLKLQINQQALTKYTTLNINQEKLHLVIGSFHDKI